MLRSLFSTRDLDSPQLYTIGVQLDEYEPGLVRAVLEGSPAAAAGIRREDRIVAVDDVQFESLLQWQQPTSISLLLRRQEEEHEVRLTPILQGFHRALAQATRASGSVLECGDRSIGYLHLWSGTHSEFLEILKDSIAEARAMGLDGFILDLRDGYGGAWWDYLDPFYQDRSEYFAYATRDARGTADAVQADPQINHDAWAGPLAVIINSGTRSGKESLAYQFKKQERARLFGTTTAGAFTAGRGVFADRAANYILYLSVQELILDGTAIEGVGVTPDVIVEDNAERDDPLAAAIKHLGC
ncbi:MAG: S41 family peptidase [Cellvibrionaceae bacterium]